ncbi:MAG: hypothetical protein PHS41_06800 [Victivallaceae bacterium]|nr:hypothetical protein [Victivallaceae bacterium]
MRSYLIETLCRIVRETAVDGLKLDFLDSFQLPDCDPAAATNYAGCDYRNLPEATEALLEGILSGVRAIRPEILLEFRQCYTGPAMRRFGNIFRASDCAFDLLENRVRTIDLRLLAGTSAVHSDMAAWFHADSAQVAALQIQSVLFSALQISMRLATLPESHKRMLTFWLSFAEKHRETLLFGELIPEHPELSYPVVSAVGASESVSVLYEEDRAMRCPDARQDRWIAVNSTHSGVMHLELPGKSEKGAQFPCRIFDESGVAVGATTLGGGWSSVEVPVAGFIEIDLQQQQGGIQE